MGGMAAHIMEFEAGASADIGAVSDTAETDPTAETSVIAALKGLIKQLQGDGSGAVPISIGGVALQLDDTDKIAVSLYGKDSAAGDVPIKADSSGYLLASLITSLSSEYDTLNVNKMSKGGITQDTGKTASYTGDEIDFRGHNAAHVQFEITAESGRVDIEILESEISGGTFSSQKANGYLKKITGLTANCGFIVPVSGTYAKLDVTEIVDGATVSITVIPVIMPINFTGFPVKTLHHNAASAAADGTDAALSGKEQTLTLQTVNTSSTSRTIAFYGSVDGTNFIALEGVNLATGATATTTTGIDELWQFDVSGLIAFRADLTAVAGGSLSAMSIAV